MKIGIDGRLWNQTGVGRYIRNLVYNLQEIDKSNDYVLYAGNEDYQELKFQISNRKSDKWRVIPTNIHWHSVAEQIKFPSLLNRENFDLVHFPYFSVPIFYNKPFVVTIHDLIIYHFSTGRASTLPAPIYFAKNLAYKTIVSQGARKARNILVPLNWVKEDVTQTLNIPAEKITVTKEGFSLDEENQAQHVKASEFGEYFLYVGNAYPHKNLENLIAGFSLFKQLEKSKNVKLILVGKQDFFYLRLQKELDRKLISSVIVVPNITDSELADLYTHAISYVSASLMEGFGLPPLEALSSHCLPVLSDIPAFREVCDTHALYFDPKSIESIAKTLQEAYTIEPNEKAKYLRLGKQQLRQFSWKKMAVSTLEVYEQSRHI